MYAASVKERAAKAKLADPQESSADGHSGDGVPKARAS
jgi:hypothetical protein